MLDTSRHMDAIGEIDTDGAARARRPGRRAGGPQPRRAAARARLRPGHLDVEPGDARRDDRQQLVGQPLDRLRHHDRPRARARGRAGGRLARASLGPRPSAARSRRRSATACAEILRDHARRDRDRLPAPLAPVRRLPARPPRARASTSRASSSAPRARWWRSPRRPSGSCRCRRRGCSRVGHFDSVADAIAATDDALELDAGGGRADRPHDPRAVALQARVPAAGRDARGRPEALLFVTFFGDTRRGGARRGSTGSRRRGARTATATTRCAPRRPAEQDALTKVRKAGLGLLMAASSGARRPLAFVEDTAVAPERLGRLRRALQGDPRPPRADGRLLRPRVGRLPAHPPVRRPHRAGRDRDDARRRRGGRGARRRVRRRELVRARRRAASAARSTARIFGDELYEAMRRRSRRCSTRTTA